MFYHCTIDQDLYFFFYFFIGFQDVFYKSDLFPNHNSGIALTHQDFQLFSQRPFGFLFKRGGDHQLRSLFVGEHIIYHICDGIFPGFFSRNRRQCFSDSGKK